MNAPVTALAFGIDAAFAACALLDVLVQSLDRLLRVQDHHEDAQDHETAMARRHLSAQIDAVYSGIAM
jgi:hypothetical protein